MESACVTALKTLVISTESDTKSSLGRFIVIMGTCYDSEHISEVYKFVALNIIGGQTEVSI